MLAALTAAAQPPPFNCSTQPAGAYDPITLRNSRGLEATFIRYGATLTHLLVPDASWLGASPGVGGPAERRHCRRTG